MPSASAAWKRNHAQATATRRSGDLGISAVSETRKLAAILVADIVGYSRLAGADEDRILARLRTLRSDLIDPILAVHHGRVVKRTGDGAIVEFRSVVDAVRCAIEVQSGLAERNAGLPPEKRIEYRVGIHLGDVVEESDGDLMGDGVNIAARLEGVARPGTICLSEDAYRQVSGRLEMSVTDLGPTKLKNIDKSIRAYLLEVGKPTSPRLTQKWRLVSAPLAAALAALVFLAVASGWYLLGGRAPKPVEAAHLSIVVLPFANLSGDPGQDYLVDALTDELTTSLARIPGTFVIARNTAMTFKGKPIDAKAIGKDLGVRYVLEGSVQPAGNQVRVNAQLIDAGSGAHLWAEQFDTPRADLLQMQDEIVIHLARAMEIGLPEAEAARLKQTRAANPDAEDLALQCQAALEKAGWLGKEADAGYPLCEQALRVDPNNVRALWVLGVKFHQPVNMGTSADPKADLARADELVSKALALDPTAAGAHDIKGWILFDQGRVEEAIAERERALALDPADVGALNGLAWDHVFLGHFDKALELFDKAIRLSPRDGALQFMYFGKSWANFGLKRYDQAIDWARRAIAIGPNNPFPHAFLTAALALTGHEAEAREALQHYLALPSSSKLRTIAALKAYEARFTNVNTDPRVLESNEREHDGLRKAGMPEE
jgi:TolB-like protein/class 3 adenylate cyclase/cytochrome c-type biogenesis protein CcmH/NrfG